MSAANYKAPISATTGLKDAVAMSGGYLTRLGPKKGGGRAMRRALQREQRREQQVKHHHQPQRARFGRRAQA